MELAAFVDGTKVSASIVEIAGQRPLRCLQTQKDSQALTIFLHGLGLDAYDYLPYLNQHEGRGIAVTLRGFDQDPEQLEPETLETHAKLISLVIDELTRKYSGKQIILVGFSLGADLILRLCEYWRDHDDHRPKLSAAILLDPNVNYSTMTISSIFARTANPGFGTAAKKLIAELPETDDALITTICEYIGRIGVKDFRHIHQLSQDAVSYWKESGHSGYHQIGARLATVSDFATVVRVILSGTYAPHVDKLRDSVVGRAIEVDILRTKDHFDLISSPVLADQLRSVLQTAASIPA